MSVMGTSPDDFPEMVTVKADPGRKCKVSFFPLNHFGAAMEEDLYMTRDDFPAVTAGDLVEIYNPDPAFDTFRPRLLLKVISSRFSCSDFRSFFFFSGVLSAVFTEWIGM
jgi:hypothetical protein